MHPFDSAPCIAIGQRFRVSFLFSVAQCLPLVQLIQWHAATVYMLEGLIFASDRIWQDFRATLHV